MEPANLDRIEIRQALQAVLSWAEQRCPCENEKPDPCPLCDATVAEGRCLSAECTMPRWLLRQVREGLAHPVGHDWQPIETAPRDGARLWLYWPNSAPDDRQSVGWWHESIHGSWWMDRADTERENPTHWMPLPQAPGAQP